MGLHGGAWRWLLVAGLLTSACSEGKDEGQADTAKADEKKESEEDDAGEKPAASASAAPSATVTVEDLPPVNPDYGPMIKVPAGKLMAGSKCFDIPRIRPNELEHVEMSMAAFEMDMYPYPNEPGKEALVNVTWDEAKKKCEERGKRLCTELEWERACKGPKNETYMWGRGFKKEPCPGQLDHEIGARETCKTDFGVMDMMGVVLEWTGSDWTRGTGTGDKVVRGAREKVVSWLSARCTHSRKRDPSQTYDNVGFRCCAGLENPAKVMVGQRKDPTIVEYTSIDDNFQKILMRGMPKDHRAIEGVELTFDEVYRWHPVANEEMLVARWTGDKGGRKFHEIAFFKRCANTAFLTARIRGPVEKVSKPKEGTRANRLEFDVASGGKTGKVKARFWHGTVKIDQPSWIEKGNQLGSSRGG